jgi:RimJ/RimL family protein N-acetyltransferase
MKLSNVSLQTRRLLIREFRPSDWKDVNAYSRLPRTVRFLPWGPDHPNQTKDFIRRMIKDQKKKTRLSYEFVLESKTEKKVIGACGLRIKSLFHQESDMGYVLHPDYWGQGYATEAARALAAFGFKQLKLHRVWATCDVNNKASEKVLKKCGMRKEGHFRSHLRLHGKWRSSFLYAILESDKKRKLS